jgi:hypothetical protein
MRRLRAGNIRPRRYDDGIRENFEDKTHNSRGKMEIKKRPGKIPGRFFMRFKLSG